MPPTGSLAQGVDCFGVFMQSGLPKEVLKAVWELVAGDAGHLSRHQFVQVRQLASGGVRCWRKERRVSALWGACGDAVGGSLTGTTRVVVEWCGFGGGREGEGRQSAE